MLLRKLSLETNAYVAEITKKNGNQTATKLETGGKVPPYYLFVHPDCFVL